MMVKAIESSPFAAAVKRWVEDLKGLPDFTAGASLMARCNKRVAEAKKEMMIAGLVREITSRGQKFFCDLTVDCTSYAGLQKYLNSFPRTEEKEESSIRLERANTMWSSQYDNDSNVVLTSSSKKVQFTSASLSPGEVVVAQNVRLSPSLNGKEGKIIEVDYNIYRAKVEFPLPHGILSLRTSNLQPSLDSECL
eukprot:TRINITY_DN4848_c0_g2_i1.p1 TRINITY_DN4848_c0_g2~~TRINITY_DN4848_c0_g2_i1.p1  ORF type:complete len:194 (+),score=24.30 TRINITY_DN4848_c0_g2_i1:96-677(+)